MKRINPNLFNCLATFCNMLWKGLFWKKAGHHKYTINSSTILTEYFERLKIYLKCLRVCRNFLSQSFSLKRWESQDFAGRYYNYGKFETICRRAGYTNQRGILHFYKIFYAQKSVILFSILFFTQFLPCWQWKLDE